MKYYFQRGETIRIPLLLLSGDKGEIDSITADLKKAVNNAPPKADAPVVFAFDVIDADTGWILEISAEDSATLSPGGYATNAVIETDGQVFKSDHALIIIKEST